MSDKFTIGLTVETSTSFEIILWEFNPGLFPCNVVYGQNRPRAFVNSVLKIFEKYRYGGEEVEDERDAKLYRIMWSPVSHFLRTKKASGTCLIAITHRSKYPAIRLFPNDLTAVIYDATTEEPVIKSHSQIVALMETQPDLERILWLRGYSGKYRAA
jgi:hypothetical protein